MKTIEVGYRTQSVLITADNVLTPEVMHKVIANNYIDPTGSITNYQSINVFFFQLALISDEISNLNAKASNGTTLRWNDVCFKSVRPDTIHNKSLIR